VSISVGVAVQKRIPGRSCGREVVLCARPSGNEDEAWLGINLHVRPMRLLLLVDFTTS
jgi:hypothetical protein